LLSELRARTNGLKSLVLAVCAVALTAAQNRPAPAGTSPDGFRVEYIRILKEYISGDADRAVADLTKLPPTATHTVKAKKGKQWESEQWTPSRGFSLTPRASQGFPTDLSELRMSFAAVMVETEAAFLGNRGDILIDRLANADIWIKSVAQLFPRATWGDFRRRWSLVVGRKVLWSAVQGTADQILSEACELFGDDPSLHVAYGHARETTAFVAGATTPLDRSVASHSRRQALSDARAALERALRLDVGSPLSIEARVRLAHVYVLLGDDRRASPLLQQTLSRDSPQTYKYLATVMLGDIEARSQRIDRASELFLGARAVLPGAQNTYIAHAHALRAAGQADEAVKVINEMLARRDRVADPWVQYPKGLDLEATRLEPLREYVRQMDIK
jgi:tetratricopeptide (TPR) repeat protein